MNERIKLLAEQATEVVPEKVWDENNGMYYSENRSRLNSEKFAELIVRECAAIADSIGEHGYIASEEMLEHFGVKE